MIHRSARLAVPPSPNLSAGFTLVELLVVIVIIGIMLTTAVLSIGDNRLQQLEDESRRIVALLGIASEEAILQSSQYAFEVNDEQYRFLVFKEDNWQPVTDDHLLRKRTIPEEMHIEVRMEDIPASLASGTEDAPPVRVFILSSGEMTPFEIIVRNDLVDDQRYFRLAGDALGRVTLEGPIQ